MYKNFNQYNSYEGKLYNKILLLSRNKLFYTKFGLNDTFQNRIILIFFHISFLFIKSNQKSMNKLYKKFYQKMFDFTFNSIEINMREIGFGDTVINKNMKSLIKSFYNILLFCENYKNQTNERKASFLTKHLSINTNNKNGYISDLVRYFNKYQAFCFDLSPDSVLSGELKFNYNNI